MICNFGDIVVVAFPFVDRPHVKRRPALVISNSTFNQTCENSVLAMITTAVKFAWPEDIPITTLDGTGLAHASIVRWKLFTLPNDLILRYAGSLGTEIRNSIEGAISSHFTGQQ